MYENSKARVGVSKPSRASTVNSRVPSITPSTARSKDKQDYRPRNNTPRETASSAASNDKRPPAILANRNAVQGISNGQVGTGCDWKTTGESSRTKFVPKSSTVNTKKGRISSITPSGGSSKDKQENILQNNTSNLKISSPATNNSSRSVLSANENVVHEKSTDTNLSTNENRASRAEAEWKPIRSVNDADEFCSNKQCASCDTQKASLKLLPCLHSMCMPCLERSVVHDKSPAIVSCPLCTKRIEVPQATGLSGFEDNLYCRLSELSVSENARCYICEDRSPTCRCSECKHDFCTDCVPYHLKREPEKDHYIVNVTQEMVGRAPSDVACEEHRRFTLELFCTNCSVPICGRCAINKHNNHIAEDIHFSAHVRRTDLQRMLHDRAIRNLLIEIDDHLMELMKQRTRVQEEINNTLHAIDSHVQRLKNDLDEFAKRLSEEARERERTTLANLDKNIEETKHRQKAIGISLETFRNVVERTRDIDFIKKFPNLQEFIFDLKMSAKPGHVQCIRSRYIAAVQSLQSSIGRLVLDTSLKHPIELSVICTIQLSKPITSICTVGNGKAWIGHRKYIQLCTNDGSLGPLIDVGDPVCGIAESSAGAVFIACKTTLKVFTTKQVLKTLFPLVHEPSDIKCNMQDELIISFKDAKRLCLFTTKGRAIKDFDIRHFGFRFGLRFSEPWKIAQTDDDGDVFISDFTSENIGVFDKDCEMKRAFPGKVYKHGCICIDRGLLYILDYKRDCVHVYSVNSGQFLQTCTLEGTIGPCCVAIDKSGCLWVASWGGFVKVYRPV